MAAEDARLGYRECRELLARRLSEPAPGRIQLLSGPRQVGKTTLLLELAELLGDITIYAAADSPEARVPGFWERLWGRADEVAVAKGRAVVMLDEAHVLENWTGYLNAQWDRIRRHRLAVHVVATGSSALRLAAGSRESLAGRFERLTLTHWSASSLADVFEISPQDAAHYLVRMGSYPAAFEFRDDRARYCAYVRDAVMEPAIGRDIAALGAVRRPAVLRQVFGVCAGSPAQIVSLQKIQAQLQDAGALETIAHYLALLEEAFLVAPLAKHGTRAARRRAAPPKLVTLSNAFLAVANPHGVPDPGKDPARFDAWVENACLAHAWNAGQRVTYWREEPLEIDGVIEGSWGSWAIEVKTGGVTDADLGGLMEFTRRHPAYSPLVLCDETSLGSIAQAGIEAIAWTDFLLPGPPSSR
jgi:predicted AAA+ superfamily ATPase